MHYTFCTWAHVYRPTDGEIMDVCSVVYRLHYRVCYAKSTLWLIEDNYCLRANGNPVI